MKKVFVVCLSICLVLGSCAGAFAAAPVSSAFTEAVAGRSASVPGAIPDQKPSRAPGSMTEKEDDLPTHQEEKAGQVTLVPAPTPAPKPTLSPEQIKRLARLEKELKELTEKKKEYEERVAPFRTMAHFMAMLVNLHKTYGIHPSLVIELMVRLRLPIPIFPMTMRDLEDIAFYKEEIERLERKIAQVKEEIRKIKEGKA